MGKEMTIDIMMTRSVPTETGTTITIIRTKEPSEELSLVGLGIILGISSSTKSVVFQHHCIYC